MNRLHHVLITNIAFAQVIDRNYVKHLDFCTVWIYGMLLLKSSAGLIFQSTDHLATGCATQ